MEHTITSSWPQGSRDALATREGARGLELDQPRDLHARPPRQLCPVARLRRGPGRRAPRARPVRNPRLARRREESDRRKGGRPHTELIGGARFVRRLAQVIEARLEYDDPAHG